jgi:hypothetical protein
MGFRMAIFRILVLFNFELKYFLESEKKTDVFLAYADIAYNSDLIHSVNLNNQLIFYTEH